MPGKHTKAEPECHDIFSDDEDDDKPSTAGGITSCDRGFNEERDIQAEELHGEVPHRRFRQDPTHAMQNAEENSNTDTDWVPTGGHSGIGGQHDVRWYARLEEEQRRAIEQRNQQPGATFTYFSEPAETNQLNNTELSENSDEDSLRMGTCWDDDHDWNEIQQAKEIPVADSISEAEELTLVQPTDEVTTFLVEAATEGDYQIKVHNDLVFGINDWITIESRQFEFAETTTITACHHPGRRKPITWTLEHPLEHDYVTNARVTLHARSGHPRFGGVSQHHYKQDEPKDDNSVHEEVKDKEIKAQDNEEKSSDNDGQGSDDVSVHVERGRPAPTM